MSQVNDFNGLEVGKGDMVAPLTGDFRGRVAEVKVIDGEGFVCIRPTHRPYSKGVWYASEHVQRLQQAPAEPASGNSKARPGSAAKAKSASGSRKKGRGR